MTARHVVGPLLAATGFAGVAFIPPGDAPAVTLAAFVACAVGAVTATLNNPRSEP